MLCPRCQTECPEENNFCHKCGADLHEQRVRDNLSLRLPSGHTDNKKPGFLPIQHSLSKAEAEKAETRPVSLSKETDTHKSAVYADLGQRADSGAERADFRPPRAEAGESVIGTEPGQAEGGPSPDKESSERKAAGLSLAKAVPGSSESRPEGSAAVGPAAVFSPFSKPAQRVSLSKEYGESAESGGDAGFAESAAGAAETEEVKASQLFGGFSGPADAGERAGAAEKDEAASSAVPEGLTGAAESSARGEEIFVGIPQRVSVFSGHGVREGSKLNTQELVDKTLAGWNNSDVQPIPQEKRDEHVGLRAEEAPAKSPFADAVQAASEPDPKPEAAKPAGNETRVLNAEDGKEIASVNTDFRTVKNVFGGSAPAAPASEPFAQRWQAGAVMSNGGSAPAAPTSEAFSQREHAKAIINEVPRANGKGNDSAFAGKVGIVIASCGCLVVFALISLIFVVWLMCF